MLTPAMEARKGTLIKSRLARKRNPAASHPTTNSKRTWLKQTYNQGWVIRVWSICVYGNSCHRTEYYVCGQLKIKF
eukprot:scaffold157687_cov17-Tisochrysis_lutea.AAC.1